MLRVDLTARTLLAHLLVVAIAPIAAGQIVFAPPHNVTDGDGLALGGNVLAGDFDGDGTIDVAALDGALAFELTVLLGDGGGALAALPAQALPPANNLRAVADVDVDGDLDLLAGGNSVTGIVVLPGHGDGTFAAPLATSALGADFGGVAAADVDHDGLTDFVVGSGSITLHTGLGDGSFVLTQSFPSGAFLGLISQLALADLDGDTWLELLACGSYVQLQSFPGNASGGFGTISTSLPVPTAQGGGGVAVGDFNGDALPDVAGTDALVVGVALALGDGAFSPAVLIPLPSALYTQGVLLMGDWDGDGLHDLATVAATPTDLVLLRSLGDGHFAPPVHVTQGSVRLGDAADLDGDGRDEILAYANVVDQADAPGAVLVPNATYGDEEPFLDLGGALPGSAGWPILLCSGSLQADRPFRFELAAAAPSSTPLLVVGHAVSGQGFAGGTLWPEPDRLIAMPVVDAEGGSTLSGTWPPGLQGVTLWLQIWIPDAGSVQGWAATSGVIANGP